MSEKEEKKSEKMMYDTILARSFSRYDQKKLRCGAFLACLLIALSFCTVFKPYLGPLTVINNRPSMDIGPKMLSIITVVNETRSAEIEMVVSDNTGGSNETIISNDAIRFNTTVIPVINESFDTNLTRKNDTVPSADEDPMMSSSKIPKFNYTNNVSISKNKVSSNRPVSVSEVNNENSSQQFKGFAQEKIIKPICNVEERTEFCEMNGDVRIHGKSSTVFMPASSQNSSRIVSPYARKGDEEAMNHVTKWTVKSGLTDGYDVLSRCDRNHGVPAIVFSLGGYAGNNFHDYTDIVIPLYLTSRQFNGEVKFLITDKNPFWTNKFKTILRKLSRYEVIEVDNEEQVHCFPTVIVGLKRDPKELRIDPLKSPHSMKEFRQFLRSAYSLNKGTAIKMNGNVRKRRPRLLILSRRSTRAFMNTKGIVKMAISLGYKVVVAEADSNIARVAETVNACDVMMGVHGAGLTNMVFLPENAIVIQILPIGGFEWIARNDFEEPSKDMNLRYLEYKIKTEESTLIQKYPPHHEVLNNPSAIKKQGWNAFKSVYLQQQNVKLDIHRFRPTLLKALELLHQ